MNGEFIAYRSMKSLLRCKILYVEADFAALVSALLTILLHNTKLFHCKRFASTHVYDHQERNICAAPEDLD